MFLSSGASIAIYGGAAGGGKSYALLLECLRHIDNPGFGAIVFRKNANQVFAEGSLWDTALSLYPLAGGEARKTPKPCFVFPSGAKVTFAHLERDEDVLGYQGSQIPLLCFDELCHFTRYQFFTMLSRNRSLCGVKPYVRATCNPDAASFVAELIDWYIDPETGYPLEERAGVVRWFLRREDRLYWAGAREELWERFDLKGAERDEPRSFTFVPSNLTDNAALMRANPEYLANLKALPTVERERLLHGNWRIMPASGLYFKRSEARLVAGVPIDVAHWVRAWDLAATDNRPDSACTAGVLLGMCKNGRFVVADVVNERLNAEAVRRCVANTAAADKEKYGRVRVRVSQDPGQAGKDQAAQYVRMLAGYDVAAVRESGDKRTRAEPFAAQWQGGNVDVVAADWNEAYFGQLERFPERGLKDMVDASANAFNELTLRARGLALPERAGGAARESYWK